MARHRLAVLTLALAGSITARQTAAHQGPPFPILVDQRVGPYVASVWSDPDIGTGTFYVVLDAPKGRAFIAPSTARIAVRPVSGRLPEVVYNAEPQKVSEGARFFAAVRFDKGEMWNVRVQIEGPQGGGQLTTTVEATPDGTIGPISLLVYLVPFLAVGSLWLKAALVKRAAPPSPATTRSSGTDGRPFR